LRLLGAAGTSLATGATASAMEGSILSTEVRAQGLDRILRGSCRDVESRLFESKAVGDWDLSHPAVAVRPSTSACKDDRISSLGRETSAEPPCGAEYHPLSTIR
jgi:hypothetical protein